MNLQEIGCMISQKFEEMDRARDKGLADTRKVIKSCGLAIRAIHREQFADADTHLALARKLLDSAASGLRDYPEIYFGGFLQDAEKEYAEARITYAVVQDRPVPTPEDIGVDFAPYLNGMAEAVGEMRRHILDRLRRGETDKGEQVLTIMDDIYYLLISMDFPDTITRGLRRSTDMARGCLEKTRGDLTNHSAGHNLERELVGLRRRLNREADQWLEAALKG